MDHHAPSAVLDARVCRHMNGSPSAYSRKYTSNAQKLRFGERIRYRIRQFWHSLISRPDPTQIEQAKMTLSAAAFKLFLQMQPSEQAHSLQVMERLKQHGQTHPDLLAAALLHDAGKSRRPLATWERVVIVLGKTFTPTKVDRWGQETGSNPGLKKAFVVAAQHPQWGADLAEQAGCQPLTVNLIRRHQDPFPLGSDSVEDQLLMLLQTADDEN